MPARVVLLLPRYTYRNDFVGAAEALGLDIVIGADFRQAMAQQMGERALHLDFADPSSAASAIAALHLTHPVDAVVAADEQGVMVAAAANERLGLRSNSVGAAAASRDKLVLRERLAAAGVAQPAFFTSDLLERGEPLPFCGPYVVKPRRLSASQGVLRVDRGDQLPAAVIAAQRVACLTEPVLVEGFVPGVEIAVEGLLRNGELDVLATFDKPDPLHGPTFPETLYVTPSRLSPELLRSAHDLVGRAVAAVGLSEGPVHAEVRVDVATDQMWLIEAAGRSIGGLCSRTLRFGLGVSLEELILRHALGWRVPPLRREQGAAGVVMLPVLRTGIVRAIGGVGAAEATEGVEGVEITVTAGTRVQTLPDGDRYLGFIFARAPTPAAVEAALRAAWAELGIEIEIE